jgi:gentisate 1,2-dioxygenase
MIFPTTLKDLAFQWYDHQAHGTFPNWISLRDEFLAQFMPLGFFDRLHEQLTQIQMVLGKSITFYAIGMEDILRRWNNHSIPNHM